MTTLSRMRSQISSTETFPNGLIVTSGNVGIGTSSPSYPLTVLRNNDGQIFNLSISSGGWYGASFASGGTFLHAYTGTTSPITYAAIGTYDNIPLLINQNNTERMRITSSGSVGIGTSNPTATLSVYNPTASPADTYIDKPVNSLNGSLILRGGPSNSTSGMFIARDGGATGTYNPAGIEICTGGAERMRITSSGNVGIGTGSPICLLDAGGGNIRGQGLELSAAYSTILMDAYYDGNWRFRGDGTAWGIGSNFGGTSVGVTIAVSNATNASGAAALLTWTPVANFTKDGRVGIGTNSPLYQLHLSTDSAAKPTSNTWTISSDARVKTVSGPYDRGLSDVIALAPKIYRLNGQYGTVDDGKNHVSIIAQDIEQTWPEMLGRYEHIEIDESTKEEISRTELLSLNTNELQWALVNAIKELKAEVNELRAQVQGA